MIVHDVLKNQNLSLTSNRIEILSILAGAKKPLSEKEIEEKMEVDCNRTTIYRNLGILLQKGIIYRIIAEGALKYKYPQTITEQEKFNKHVHFKCTQCESLICLHDIPVQPYSLPEGFTGNENQFLIVGICRECNSK